MLRVVAWEEHFENNRTKELKKLGWVPFPNKHDGDGYTELLDHKNGAAHYGAWCALVQVASKCDPRGTLSRDGARPHDARSLARVTRIPEGVMSEAIARLVNQVGWLEIIPDPEVTPRFTQIPQEGAGLSQEGAPRVRAKEGNGREWKGTEEKGTEGKGCCGELALPDSPPTASAVSLVFPVVGNGPTEWCLSEAMLREYEQAFPGIDVLQECRNARQWCVANARKRKTPSGMPAFVVRWLTKAQNSGTAGASRTKTLGDPRGNLAVVNQYLQELEDGGEPGLF